VAELYERAGAPEQARQVYQDALKARPDDDATLQGLALLELSAGRRADAEGYLRQIVRSAAPASEAGAWARNVLAVITAADRDPQRSRQALEMLGATRPDESVADLRTRALVFALQPGAAARGRAIEALGKIVARNAAIRNDRFLLAQLLDLDGAWSKARDELRGLLELYPEDTPCLAYFVRALLRHSDPAEAQLWLGKLESLEPDAPRTIELKARLAKALGKDVEAATLLSALAQDQPDQLPDAARLLEALGLGAAAEDLFRRSVAMSTRPEAILELAGFLGRQGRTREALDLCERAWQTCPPALVATTSVSVLQGTDDSARAAEHLERVQGWLEPAVRQHPDQAGLKVALALLRGFQGRHQEAEQIYRQILAKDPKSLAALNNLAWVLAVKDRKGAEAETLIARAIDLAGPIPDFRDTRALVALSLGRSDRAVEDLVEATRQAPTALSLFHLALAYSMARDSTAAARSLQLAREYGLRPGILDPLERPSYEVLIGELARN
jgi:tetratricopeptide (TPR) repeat protein